MVKRIFRNGPCCNENKLGVFACRRTDSDSRSIILILKSSSTSTHCHKKTGSLSACSGTCDRQQNIARHVDSRTTNSVEVNGSMDELGSGQAWPEINTVEKLVLNLSEVSVR